MKCLSSRRSSSSTHYANIFFIEKHEINFIHRHRRLQMYAARFGERTVEKHILMLRHLGMIRYIWYN